MNGRLSQNNYGTTSQLITSPISFLRMIIAVKQISLARKSKKITDDVIADLPVSHSHKYWPVSNRISIQPLHPLAIKLTTCIEPFFSQPFPLFSPTSPIKFRRFRFPNFAHQISQILQIFLEDDIHAYALRALTRCDNCCNVELLMEAVSGGSNHREELVSGNWS